MHRDNIRYDLLRTGSVQQTTEKILSRGFLEAPPAAYYTLYPREGSGPNNRTTIAGSANSQQRAGGQSNGSAAATAGSSKPKDTLITRFGLQDRIASTPAATASAVDLGNINTPEEIGGKAVWEVSAEKREASLRERKAKMILAARQRMLAQEQQKQAPPS
ncbi:hypothetical protein AX16_000810 [Volvariella volvacea WC 439]|nr:hypothetical protein AX16_000810 [Volvariella volvacea WC 439]